MNNIPVKGETWIGNHKLNDGVKLLILSVSENENKVKAKVIEDKYCDKNVGKKLDYFLGGFEWYYCPEPVDCVEDQLHKFPIS